jgi:hypothetical protein
MTFRKKKPNQWLKLISWCCIVISSSLCALLAQYTIWSIQGYIQFYLCVEKRNVNHDSARVAICSILVDFLSITTLRVGECCIISQCSDKSHNKIKIFIFTLGCRRRGGLWSGRPDPNDAPVIFFFPRLASWFSSMLTAHRPPLLPRLGWPAPHEIFRCSNVTSMKNPKLLTWHQHMSNVFEV